jgi:hypothetical protein
MPVDARETAGWMFSRGRDHGLGPHGDHLGIGGAGTEPGKLVFVHSDETTGSRPPRAAPKSSVGPGTTSCWSATAEKVRVHLNGDPQPEIETQAPAAFPAGFDRLFFGGRCDNQDNWEGRLDEIAVFPRALSPEEVASLPSGSNAK